MVSTQVLLLVRQAHFTNGARPPAPIWPNGIVLFLPKEDELAGQEFSCKGGVFQQMDSVLMVRKASLEPRYVATPAGEGKKL